MTQDEKSRINNTRDIYASYRSGNISEKIIIDDQPGTIENQIINENVIEDLIRRIQNLEEQRSLITTQEITQQQKTEQEILIDRIQNELLTEILASKKQGRRDVSGRIKVLVFPTNYRRNVFQMNYNALTSTIQEAINLIISQARNYNQNISIDWEYRINNDGTYVSLNNYSEGLRQHSHYKSIFNNYNHIVLIYAVDLIERSYCVLNGPLGRSESNAIIWFKDNNGRHSAGVLAHEIFHAFGAEDLYYEQGVVPQEVETNFRALLGNSIMITSRSSSNLDPINAWLLGWNKNPEPWYAWFIDRRDNTVDIGLYSIECQNLLTKE